MHSLDHERLPERGGRPASGLANENGGDHVNEEVSSGWGREMFTVGPRRPTHLPTHSPITHHHINVNHSKSIMHEVNDNDRTTFYELE